MSTASGREKSPKDLVWDCLVEHFGEPRTKTERTMFGKVVAELLEAGANEDEVGNACAYVLRSFDSPSVFAVVKWFSKSQQHTPVRMSQSEQMLDELRRKQ